MHQDTANPNWSPFIPLEPQIPFCPITFPLPKRGVHITRYVPIPILCQKLYCVPDATQADVCLTYDSLCGNYHYPLSFWGNFYDHGDKPKLCEDTL